MQKVGDYNLLEDMSIALEMFPKEKQFWLSEFDYIVFDYLHKHKRTHGGLFTKACEYPCNDLTFEGIPVKMAHEETR